MFNNKILRKMCSHQNGRGATQRHHPRPIRGAWSYLSSLQGGAPQRGWHANALGWPCATPSGGWPQATPNLFGVDRGHLSSLWGGTPPRGWLANALGWPRATPIGGWGGHKPPLIFHPRTTMIDLQLQRRPPTMVPDLLLQKWP